MSDTAEAKVEATATKEPTENTTGEPQQGPRFGGIGNLFGLGNQDPAAIRAQKEERTALEIASGDAQRRLKRVKQGAQISFGIVTIFGLLGGLALYYVIQVGVSAGGL